MGEAVSCIPELDRESVRKRFAQLREHVAGALLFVSEKHADQIVMLQEEARAARLPILGAIFPALITNGSFNPHCAVLVFPLPYMPDYRLIGLDRYDADPDSVLSELEGLVGHASQRLAGTPSLMLIFDAQFQKIASFLDRLYLRLGDATRYTGACAGSETFLPMPCVFDAEHLLGNALLAIAMPGLSPAGVAHGYQAAENTFIASSIRGNRIDQINWQPALDMYVQLAAANYGLEVTPESFYQAAVHFPLGISRLIGESVVRIPVALGEAGSIYCVGEIPENAILTMLKAPQAMCDTLLETIAEPVERAETDTVMLFYCAGRRLHMQTAAETELCKLSDRFQQRTVAGAVSLGEINSSESQGYPLFQNACIVAQPW